MEPTEGAAHLDRGDDLGPEVRPVSPTNELVEDGKQGGLEGRGLLEGAGLRLPAVDGGGIHTQELSEDRATESEGFTRGYHLRAQARRHFACPRGRRIVWSWRGSEQRFERAFQAPRGHPNTRTEPPFVFRERKDRGSKVLGGAWRSRQKLFWHSMRGTVSSNRSRSPPVCEIGRIEF